MKPLVSICIPTYNGEKFIQEAMDSAIVQNYSNLEIIVSDDASSDNSLTIIASFQKQTTIPIRIFHHTPQGIGANWNHCVQQAKGEYIKFLFQDDTLEQDCINKMMNIALSNPSVGLVYCKRHFLVEKRNPEIDEFIDFYGSLHKYWDTVNILQHNISGKAYLKDKQLLNSPKNKIGEPTAVLIKKECFDTVGCFNEELKQTLDYEYWYRVMKYYDVTFLNEKLISFRLHSNQASQVNKTDNNNEIKKLYKEYYKHIFWQLHPKNKLKLLKLYHPFFKTLVLLKQKLYAD